MKTALALMLTVAFVSASACSSPVDDCGPFPDKFKTTGFETSVHRAKFSDSLGAEPILSSIEEDTLRMEHLAVQMQPRTETYHSRRSADATLHLFPTAYACSPILPTSDEVIRDIQIYSDTAFGEEYSAGDDLSALFDIVVFRRAHEHYGYRRFDLNEFLDRDPTAAHRLILILGADPPTTARVQFTVEYEQDGKGIEFYEFTTDPVVLSSE